MMDMVVTRRVSAGMEEAFEAIARQQTSCVLRQPMNAPIWLADPTPSPSPRISAYFTIYLGDTSCLLNSARLVSLF
jgi:hypothetical protein